jgi:hypothetical protein
LRKLRDNAPETAQFLATTILEHRDIDNNPRDGIEGPQQKSARLEDNAIQFTKRKSAPNRDLFYRPPKSAKIKSKNTNFLEKSDRFEDGSWFSIDGLV